MDPSTRSRQRDRTKADKVAAWVAATPADFRFSVKAQRGGSFRSLQVDPGERLTAMGANWFEGEDGAAGEDGQIRHASFGTSGMAWSDVTAIAATAARSTIATIIQLYLVANISG